MNKPIGVCPVCTGSCRVALQENQQRYAAVIAGYDAVTGTVPCSNCGGQYQFSCATGQVPLTPTGKTCTHSYTGLNAARCLTTYTCDHCGDCYQIDSSD